MVVNVTPTLGKNPLTVSFSATPSFGETPSFYKWIFRDGGQSSSQNTTHQYTTAGTYGTVLIVDEGLASQQIYSSDAGYPGVDVVDPGMQVIVSDITADFTVAPSHGYLPLTGIFQDNSIGNLTGWQWDFDDGSPQVLGLTGLYHVYDAGATYNPTLTVYDNYGLTDTTTNQIIAIDDLGVTAFADYGITYIGGLTGVVGNSGIAGYTGLPGVSDYYGIIGISVDFPLFPIAPTVVSFSPINDLYAQSWQWDLIYVDTIIGDLTVDRKSTSISSNKSYEKSIEAPGNYKIKLTIVDDLSNTYSVTESFTVLNDIQIVTDPPGATGLSPLVLDFSTTGLDFSTVDSFGWDFNGDGTIDNSTDQTPSNTYSTPGSFPPSLRATWNLQDIDNAALSTVVIVEKSITVIVGHNALVISITANPSQGHKPLTSILKGNANNSVSTWDWEIKDLSSSSYSNIGAMQQISHTFSDAATYTVRLKATDIYGATGIAYKYINVVNVLSTPDKATDPESLMEITGPGKYQVYGGGRGIRFSIPSNEVNPDPYGFKSPRR